MSLVSPAAPRKPIGMSGVGKRETKRGARSSPKTSMARTGSLPPTDLSSPWPAAGSDAGAGGDAGIRTSCVACGLRKRRCERALHAPSCTRCSRLGIPCEYVAKEKPGPKRDPNSQSSWTARERAALLRKSATSSSREESSPEASDSSSSPQTVSIGTIATTASPATDWAFTVHPGLGDQNQALTVLPEAAQTPFTPAVDPDLVHLLNNFPDISNRFAFPEAPDVDSGGFTAAGPASLAPAFWTPAPADVLPDQELLNLLLSGSFFGRVHVAFPHAILPELMVELRTPHTIPDYGLFSIMFLAARFDPVLTELVGPVRRSEILRSLFERTIASLLPAVEIALAGYDAIVGSGPINTPDAAVRRRHYTTTSIWVLLALVHLVGVAMSVPIPDDTLFNNFKAMVLLAMRVAQAARLGEERLYDDPKLVERGRRAFWGFAIFDNMHATMHNVDPVIQPEDLLLSGVKASNVSDGEILQGLGKISAMGGVLGAIATKAYKILCDSWRTPVPGGHQPPALSPDRIAAGSTGIQVPLATPEPIPLISSPVPEGPVTYRITRLAALVTQQHRRLRRPYLFKEEWTRMVAEVDECFSALPPQLRSGDTIPVFLDAARHVLGTEVGTMIGSVTYMKLMYHGIVVTLASPPDEQLYLGNVEPEWVGSEAFLLAQEHAIQATALLQPLVEAEATVPQMGLPFFQYCVVRTGLIHHVYLRSAFSVSSAPSDEIVRTAKEQFLIHAKALRKGQKALGMGESRSWWYERWLAVTGIEG